MFLRQAIRGVCMNFLERKKLAFLTIANSVKGFLRKAAGISSLTLEKCVDDKSLVSLSITGNSGGVGDYDSESGKYIIPVSCRGINTINAANNWVRTNNQAVTVNATATEVTAALNQAQSYIGFHHAINSSLMGKTITVSFSCRLTDWTENSTVRVGYFASSVFRSITGGTQNIITGDYIFTFNLPETLPSEATTGIRLFFNASAATPTIGQKITITNLMVLEGAYTALNIPDYEEYQTPINASIGISTALSENDTLEIDYKSETATINGNVIAIDWETAPQTLEGTTTIITANSTILPTAMSADYYSSVKGE